MAIEWAGFLDHIWEQKPTIFGPETGYFDYGFSWFFLGLPGKYNLEKL
jgi:hypothetical protein